MIRSKIQNVMHNFLSCQENLQSFIKIQQMVYEEFRRQALKLEQMTFLYFFIFRETKSFHVNCPQ